MKIINTTTGKEADLTIGLVITAKTGAVKGQKFILGEIIAPSEENPEGLLKSKITEGSWQAFYPSVFNLRISDE